MEADGLSEAAIRAFEHSYRALQRNETGIPEWPSTTTIPARWVDGPTLRAGAA